MEKNSLHQKIYSQESAKRTSTFSKSKTFALLAALTLLYYLPILQNPQTILERGNDLQEFFWPIFYFAKQQILENHTLPLWNNLFFSGTPLLPDPQSPLFYPPNIILLILPIGAAFIISFILHTLVGGMGMYLATRHGFKLSKGASLFSASLYITIPKLAGYLEAGHFGLATSLAWLPFVVLATVKLSKSPSFFWSTLLAISLTGVFYTHTLTFAIVAVSCTAFFTALLSVGTQRKFWLKHSAYFILGATFTFGLLAITLLPQLEWIPQTTRFLLLQDRDVYPKWASIKEFTTAIFWPWAGGQENIWQLDTEKWITLGILPTLLALAGFLTLKKKIQLTLLALGIPVLLISLNNISPIHSLLLSQDWYALGRVTTRVWFIPIIIVSLLAGLGLETLNKLKLKKVTVLLIALSAIGELVLLSWLRLGTPIPDQSNYVPEEIYRYLTKDKEKFRVFCLNKCLSQKKSAEYKLELVEGYNTLQQKNYYDQFIQLSQVFWDRYTLALPPFEIYNFRQIQPYSPEIADYNVKYVISRHPLTDKNLILKKEFGKYRIYENTIVKSRAYYLNGKKAPILNYLPGKIKIDTSKKERNELILAEVYNPGWEAVANTGEKIPIKETRSALMEMDIKKDANFIEVYYQPKSYQIGKTISLSTLSAIAIILLLQRLRRKRSSQNT